MFIYSILNRENNKEYRGAVSEKSKILKRRSYRHIKDLYEDLKNPSNFIIQDCKEFKSEKSFKEEKKKFINKDFKNLDRSYNKKVNHLVNKIIVKDSNNNISVINKTDPDYISGKLAPYMKGVRKNNKHIKGKTVVKNRSGETFFISSNDDRLKSGELFHINTRKDISEKYPKFSKEIYTKKNRKIISPNFCKHGDLIISRKHFDYIYDSDVEDKYFCELCAKESVLNNKVDINEQRNIIKNLKGIQYKENYIRKIYPALFYLISLNNHNISFKNKLFLFSNNINPPICNFPGCEKNTHFQESHNKYSDFCEKHLNNGTSELENSLFNYIKEIYKGPIFKNYKINSQELDIYIPEIKLGIEFNGLYWHSELRLNRNYHINKKTFFEKYNINILNVWEDDWNYKKDIIKSIIENRLNLSNIIYARKCEILEIKSQEKSAFLQENHLQGTCPSSINLGLYYKKELAALMTFGKKRKILNSKSKDNEYELLRFCNLKNISVVGGASKLFKYFINNYNPKNIISYANRDISNGNLYKKLNFADVKTSANLNYWWAKNGVKYHRSNFMKHKLVQNGADKTKSESEIMRNNGYYKIWGTGNLKYEWIR